MEGQEVFGNHLINESHQVSICCSFDKGNPARTFYLSDQHGDKLAASRDEKHVFHSLTGPRCKEEWPVIRCEGQRSTENRSVSLLVRCE